MAKILDPSRVTLPIDLYGSNLKQRLFSESVQNKPSFHELNACMKRIFELSWTTMQRVTEASGISRLDLRENRGILGAKRLHVEGSVVAMRAYVYLEAVCWEDIGDHLGPFDDGDAIAVEVVVIPQVVHI